MSALTVELSLSYSVCGKSRYYRGKVLYSFAHPAYPHHTGRQVPHAKPQTWQLHKRACADDKHRMCRDGNNHEGRLELVTWDCEGAETGWGACFLDDDPGDLKRAFETEYGSDEEKFFADWPKSFRWTCCGEFPNP
jgi:hypothetical protein